MAFQAKARERMRSLMSSARAVIVVSHDLASLALLCDRVMWLDHGKMQMIGPAAEVIAAYTKASQRRRATSGGLISAFAMGQPIFAGPAAGSRGLEVPHLDCRWA